MAEVSVLFFDVGGVLLTNGWDRHSRKAASERFGLDWEDFRDRHDFVVPEFEQGEIDLDTYLSRTVFYRDREFSQDEFFTFMREQSQALEASLDLLGDLSASGRYLLAMLNNESRELNEYRIDRFGLRRHFSAFLSSCYLGVRKPEPAIYQMAIDIVGRPADECLFVDDRDLNLECAALNGINTIHFTDVGRLRAELAAAGVAL